MHSKPTNHIGWVVEEFKKHGDDSVASWKAVTEPTPSRSNAKKRLVSLKSKNITSEYRVYGSVKIE